MSYKEVDLTGLVLIQMEERRRLRRCLQEGWERRAKGIERLAQQRTGEENICWAGVLSLPLVTNEGYILSLPPVFLDRNFPGEGRILRPGLCSFAFVLDKGVSWENVFYPCLGEADLELVLRAVASDRVSFWTRGLAAAANTFGPIIFPDNQLAVLKDMGDEKRRELAEVRAGYFPKELLRGFFTDREIRTQRLRLLPGQLKAFFDTVGKSF